MECFHLRQAKVPTLLIIRQCLAQLDINGSVKGLLPSRLDSHDCPRLPSRSIRKRHATAPPPTKSHGLGTVTSPSPTMPRNSWTGEPSKPTLLKERREKSIRISTSFGSSTPAMCHSSSSKAVNIDSPPTYTLRSNARDLSGNSPTPSTTFD